MHRTHNRWTARITAGLAGLMVAVGLVVAIPQTAYATTYGVNIQATSTSVPVGTSVTLTATNDSSTSAWVTICAGGFGSSAIANGYHPPGGSTVTTVSQSSAGSYQYSAFVPHSASCTESYNSSVTITWYQPTSSTTTTTATTAPPASYDVSVRAATTYPRVGSSDTITATNTGSASEWISLCSGYAGHAYAAGEHSVGSALSHAVTDSTGGSVTYYAFYSPDASNCTGSSKQITLHWTAAPEISVSPTTGSTNLGTNNTTISWTYAPPGASLHVIDTDNGSDAYSQAISGSGSHTFSVTLASPPPAGTTVTRTYKAEMHNSAGAVIASEQFVFTWTAPTCTAGAVGLVKKSATSLQLTYSGGCYPAGKNYLEVYWSGSNGYPIPLINKAGTCPGYRTGPSTSPRGMSCTLTPSPSHGYYEAYLINTSTGVPRIIACSGQVHLSLKPIDVYGLTLGASSPDPVIGTKDALTATSTVSNSEWLNVCGISGTTDEAAADVPAKGSLTHDVSSAIVGKVTYVAFASGSKACSGKEATVTVDWRASTTSHPTPALVMAAANFTPTVGQTDAIFASNTSSSSEWLNYCGTTGSGFPAAAGQHAPGGELTTSASSSSPGNVTYYGYASSSEACSGVKASVTVDWQAPPTTTTTTTTVPTGPSGNTTTTTTTVPDTTTTTANVFGNPTTTVPAPTTTTGGPIYYPTSFVSGEGSGPAADSARHNATPMSSDGRPLHARYPHPKN